MTAVDPTEAYIERLLAARPPLTPEQTAVLVRVLGPTTTDTSVSAAA